MLDAFEYWNKELNDQGSNNDRPHGGMIWEERYMMLLWMSHLSQVPFHLASLTSHTHLTLHGPQARLPKLADQCPQIAVRLINVSCEYFGVASKEREAAVKLLTRLALLEDLQSLDVHRALISWACSELESKVDRLEVRTDHTFLGLLSFVANFVASASTRVLDPLWNEILGVAQRIEALQSRSAMAEKLLIKLYRNLALHCASSLSGQVESLETAINFLMEQLAADDTSVRFAASKGLAKLASRLDQDLAMQIIDTVLEDLETDVSSKSLNFSEKSLFEPGTGHRPYFKDIYSGFRNVDARKWHGLMLTVSHFIFQRSIPASELLLPVVQLIQGLNFTQKTALGYSTGTNVRDAACFGLWSLARKYSTEDISNASHTGKRIFQVLANELVVAALLDPAGNIRRGAAAALQEMVGRHPDTIECGNGLALIQIVDYHAVASRKAAMDTISVKAMTISQQYWEWLLHGLLSWRGARFEDPDSRRKSATETRESAARAISMFATVMPSDMTHYKTFHALRYEIQNLTASQVSDRHGLLWVSQILNRVYPMSAAQSFPNLKPNPRRSIAFLFCFGFLVL